VDAAFPFFFYSQACGLVGLCRFVKLSRCAGLKAIPAFFTHSQLQQESIHDFGDPLVLFFHPKESMVSGINRFVFVYAKGAFFHCCMYLHCCILVHEDES
jgi:hypothetical protein